MKPVGLLALVAAALLLVAHPSAAQPPRIINATLQTRSAAGGIEAEFRALATQAGPVWVGYVVPAVPGDRVMCCFDSTDSFRRDCCGGCRLEPDSGITTRNQARGPVPLEGFGQFMVMVRVESRRVDRIRAFSMDCELDAGGRTVYWLEGVRPAESVALLSALAMNGSPFADEKTERRVPNGALAALALHAEPAAIKRLIAAARSAPSVHVRGQALFWVAQRAGQRAAETIANAIENDPETDVKKRAVFALSQLPRDEGVPLLIQVARTNRNPIVRKQAIFWLGQSKDPRALAFFEEVLLKK